MLREDVAAQINFAADGMGFRLRKPAALRLADALIPLILGAAAKAVDAQLEWERGRLSEVKAVKERLSYMGAVQSLEMVQDAIRKLGEVR